jgi:membrane-associated phospholipid phosphatase
MTSSGMAPNRRDTAVWTGAGLVAVLASILLLDRAVADWAHGLHRPAWCLWLTWIADVPGPAAVLGLAGASIAWLAGWRPGSAGRLLLAVCIATLMADAAKDVLKVAFGRPWPETWVNNNPSWIGTHSYGFWPFHGGAGWASFPSGHTTSIAAPCAAAWRQARKIRPLLALLPALVVIGLIGCDFHFLSDCIAGALLGTACGLAVDGVICSARPGVGSR